MSLPKSEFTLDFSAGNVDLMGHLRGIRPTPLSTTEASQAVLQRPMRMDNNTDEDDTPHYTDMDQQNINFSNFQPNVPKRRSPKIPKLVSIQYASYLVIKFVRKVPWGCSWTAFSWSSQYGRAS